MNRHFGCLTFSLTCALTASHARAKSDDHGGAPIVEESPTTPPATKAADSPAAPVALPDDPALLAKALAQNFNGTVVDVLTTPSHANASMLTYQMPERVLKPGQAICFAVPRELRGRAVNYTLIDHRQNSFSGGDWDKNPGLSSIQLHSPDFAGGDAWRYWKGPSSGPLGAKYAEERGSGNPETDNLHEWSGNVGHAGAGGGPAVKGILHTDAACVKSTGRDDVYLSRLTIKFIPKKSDRYVDGVFTYGTNVGDPVTSAGQSFATSGNVYPGALALGGGSPTNASITLPIGWKVDAEGLHIPIPKGQKVTALDVAVGDSHGSYPGAAKMSFGIREKDGATKWFVSRENVAPVGVISGTPDDDAVGSEIIVTSAQDVANVMAVRVGFSAK